MRRLTAGILAAAALAALGAAPPTATDTMAPATVTAGDEATPFPLGVCVYVRALDPDEKTCVLVEDPR